MSKMGVATERLVVDAIEYFEQRVTAWRTEGVVRVRNNDDDNKFKADLPSTQIVLCILN